MKLFTEYRGLRKELYILFIGRMMTNMGSMIWPMFTLILSQKLGLSAGTIALYMLIYSVAAFPINLIGGKLADKYNKKNIIVVCDLISIVSFIYCSFVEITFGAIAVFAVASLFQSVEWPSYDALVADFTTGADRERAYSLSYLGSNLGLVLSPTIGGILFNEHLNLAFLINGCSILLSTVLIFFFIKDVHREEDNSSAGIYEKDIDDSVSAFRYIRSNRVILVYLLISGFGAGTYAMYNYLMPLDMGLIHGENGALLYGSMTSLNCIVVVTCTALITRLFRKVFDADKMLLGEGLQLAGYIIFMFFVRSPLLCYAAIFVFTLGEIFNTLACSPFLTRRIPASHRGRIISVINVAGSVMSVIIENIIGQIHDGFGYFTSWTVVILIGAVNLAFILLLKKYDRTDYKDLYRKTAEESEKNI